MRPSNVNHANESIVWERLYGMKQVNWLSTSLVLFLVNFGLHHATFA